MKCFRGILNHSVYSLSIKVIKEIIWKLRFEFKTYNKGVTHHRGPDGDIPDDDNEMVI